MDYSWSIQILILVIASIFLVWHARTYSVPLILRKPIHPCPKSLIESDKLICEPDELWNQRKIIYRAQDKANMLKQPHPIYYVTNWEPNFHCAHARRVGRIGDGGKWVCDVFRLKSRMDCLIYSAGSQGDFSFEQDIKSLLPHCEIHTFDLELYQCPVNVCVFHQLAFGNGIRPPNSKTWQTVVNELGHENRTIDIFKVDIEGGEFSLFPDLLRSSNISLPRQILVEVHPNDNRVRHRFFESLRANNYVIFNKEPNLIMAGSQFFEYTFLKLNAQFFQ